MLSQPSSSPFINKAFLKRSFLKVGYSANICLVALVKVTSLWSDKYWFLDLFFFREIESFIICMEKGSLVVFWRAYCHPDFLDGKTGAPHHSPRKSLPAVPATCPVSWASGLGQGSAPWSPGSQEGNGKKSHRGVLSERRKQDAQYMYCVTSWTKGVGGKTMYFCLILYSLKENLWKKSEEIVHMVSSRGRGEGLGRWDKGRRRIFSVFLFFT